MVNKFTISINCGKIDSNNIDDIKEFISNNITVLLSGNPLDATIEFDSNEQNTINSDKNIIESIDEICDPDIDDLIFNMNNESFLFEPENNPESNTINIIPDNMGKISDGYHTFDELYHHRAILFSVICNQNPEIAWKSKNHEIGGKPMYDGMFIVGINTSEGQATYHYDIDPYWDMFHVKELGNAPKYDGHTPDIAIERIKMLGQNID